MAEPASQGLRAVPLHLRRANEFVRQYHRHSLPTTGGKWAVGAELAGTLVGVLIAGRPVARLLDDGGTLEVLRLATDGTRNCCSYLYSRAARIARLMGYQKVITYTLASETGASLRACGAVEEARVPAREWSRPSRGRESQPVYMEDKIRWRL